MPRCVIVLSETKGQGRIYGLGEWQECERSFRIVGSAESHDLAVKWAASSTLLNALAEVQHYLSWSDLVARSPVEHARVAAVVDAALAEAYGRA